MEGVLCAVLEETISQLKPSRQTHTDTHRHTQTHNTHAYTCTHTHVHTHTHNLPASPHPSIHPRTHSWMQRPLAVSMSARQRCDASARATHVLSTALQRDTWWRVQAGSVGESVVAKALHRQTRETGKTDKTDGQTGGLTPTPFTFVQAADSLKWIALRTCTTKSKQLFVFAWYLHKQQAQASKSAKANITTAVRASPTLKGTETHTQTQTHRHTHTQTHTDTQAHRHTTTQAHRHTDTQAQTH